MTGAGRAGADTLKQDSAKAGMKAWLACAVLLSAACAAPAWAEVVINEVETNPPGNDVDGPIEWVELYNSGDSEAYVGGWQISPAASPGNALVLPPGSFIGAGQFATYTHQPLWFENRGDSVELRDQAGGLVDATPLVVDVANDPKTWQRVRDGLDTDTASDWRPGQPTWGASNSLPGPILRSDPVTVSISAGGPYEPGDPVVITGFVSEQVMSGPRSEAEPVVLAISGPTASETLRYPDAGLGFSLQLQAGGVVGLQPGSYTATARYAGASASAEFVVEERADAPDAPPVQSVSVSTGGASYVPGDEVAISASVGYIVPFEGLKISVIAPDGARVLEGTIFPDRDGLFSTTHTVRQVLPQYGTHAVTASYGGAQGAASYEVARDARPDGVSLTLDSDAYAPGQAVEISGSSSIWVPSLNISVEGLGQGPGRNPLDVADSVRLEGDGTFSYRLEIPEWFERFGTYRVTVSGSTGKALAEFGVADSPASYSAPSDEFVMRAGSASYELGGTLELTGSVGGLAGEPQAVVIEFLGQSGLVSSRGSTGDAKGGQVPSRLLVMPDSSGAFSASHDLGAPLFSPGQYSARARYAGETAIAVFAVAAPAAAAPLSASLDKEAYGLGETVRLSGTTDSPDTAVSIVLHKPNGDIEEHGASVDSGAFEWEWRTPLSEIRREAGRTADLSNLGLHRLQVSAAGVDTRLQFAVTAGGARAPDTTLTVSAGGALHLPGSRLPVSGTAPPGGVSPVLVDVVASGSPAPLQSARVFPGPGGEYSTSFLLLHSMFPDGVYKVRALHDGERATDSFEVGEARLISVEMARDEYAPGDLAVAYASVPDSERLYNVSVIRESGTEQACGSFVCGQYAGPSAALDRGGPFAYAYRVPPGAEGAHEISVLSAPYEAHASFSVERGERMQDARSRIPDDSATVEVGPGASVMSGSLLARASDSESVRLRLEAPGGACIIGPEPDCAQSGGTGTRHYEARVFEMGGLVYWLSYTGPDARAERFELGAFQDLPPGPYVLSAVKDGQQSRLYYAVSYGP